MLTLLGSAPVWWIGCWSKRSTQAVLPVSMLLTSRTRYGNQSQRMRPKHSQTYASSSGGRVREALKTAVLDESEHWQQLAVPIYFINSGGKLQAESKKDMKERVGISPDVGDAGPA